MAFAEKANDGVFTGATAVDLVPVPISAHTFVMRNLVLHNADTVAATFIISYNNNGTLRRMYKITLDPDATATLEVVAVLDATTKKVQGALAAAHTTTAPTFVAAYGDVS